MCAQTIVFNKKTVETVDKERVDALKCLYTVTNTQAKILDRTNGKNHVGYHTTTVLEYVEKQRVK